MKLTRHRGHRGGWEAVDVERPHLVYLCCRESHTRREVTSVTCCHDGCLLLHELKKRDTGRWVVEGVMGGVGGWRAGKVREREARGGQMVMKNIVSLERVRQRQEKGSDRTRVEQREGCMLRLMDGWCMGSREKVERNKRKGRKKKPVNLCLVNLSILPAGSLSAAAETI